MFDTERLQVTAVGSNVADTGDNWFILEENQSIVKACSIDWHDKCQSRSQAFGVNNIEENETQVRSDVLVAK